MNPFSDLMRVPAGRRRFLSGLAATFAGVGMAPWLPSLAKAAAEAGKPRRCILLWMTGGPSQTDTFDMKPGHANGGTFKEIATSAPGLRFSEHLPRLAKQAEHLAVLRGLSTAEGDHGRGTFLMRTGRRPEAEIRYPTLGSLLSKELAAEEAARSPLPDYVSVNPFLEFDSSAYESGFLGPRYAPLTVRPRLQTADSGPFAELGVDHLRLPGGVSKKNARERLDLLGSLQEEQVGVKPTGPLLSHHATLERAIRLMSSDAGKVFDLSDEPAAVREKYGPGTFGQGCLLARRLIERGASFVEVSLGDSGRWDTHNDNFSAVQQLSTELDAGWGSLMEELADRGLLESTTILWMGEFGRTPQINGGGGRDHYPGAWTAVLAGGGIRGGQAYGRTSADGMTVEEGKIGVGDLLATLCGALGIDPKRQNVSDIGRPFKIAEGKPIAEVVRTPPAS
ncbi:DUF1501 domain-containing protein [Planctomyces sp. SH-PL14]|uniref:DUF1501 domain-containing protein n=1 Tax=Planctomyces sp. SH-PL14 TaxID=1632864 RepID=UPI00078D37A5|nr:DUF1501 domain-containing protein [Planctomyces sp. SH-PL14]AMV20882.1 hypothetical protein VT03_23470 [Planctomyces sp. SH-PL14]